MNRVDQSQGSKLSQTHRQTDTQTDRLTEFPLVEGPKPKALDLENWSLLQKRLVTALEKIGHYNNIAKLSPSSSFSKAEFSFIFNFCQPHPTLESSQSLNLTTDAN